MDINNKVDSISYALGMNIAESLKSQGIEELNFAALSNGLEDIVAGKDLKMDRNQAGAILNDYMQKLNENKSKGAIEEGIIFLTENAKRSEITVLESGLQYEVIIEGTGDKPKATDNVTTHYTGSLINGEVFDSSVHRGEPATFPVNGVIPGWVEALQLMPVGSKWKLYIPSALAYGEQGAGPNIGPNSTLIFEIELISIG